MKTKLLFYFILTFITLRVTAQVPNSERDALIALYTSTNGANWTDNTNWDTAQPVATWFGVSVANISGTDHVTIIDMPNNNLDGVLPAEIGDFPELNTLYLHINGGLTGVIPTEISSLSKLVSIAFLNNNMSGQIPTGMSSLPNLTEIYLQNNEFSGTIPDFSIPTKNTLALAQNNFEFGDFENEFSTYQGFSSFSYAPQNDFYEEVVTEELIGSTFTLTTNVSGTANNYQWYKVITDFWSTDPSEITTITGATNSSLTITNAQNDDFGHYFCVVTSTLVTGLEIKKEKITVLQGVPTIEKDALIALYNATDGPNWSNNTNWDTAEPVGTWFGVTVDNGHVISINKNYGNLSGVLPSELQNLTALENLSLYDNNLSGAIPDLTGITSLDRLNLGINNYTFADFENEFSTYQGFSSFSYAPQKKIATEETNDLIIGNTYNLTTPVVNGTGVTYQWYKNDVAIAGETNLTYNITNAQISDAANYTCKASSTIVTDLTIDRESIHIYGTIDPIEKNGLIELYNATDGPNWVNNTNWDTATPVYDWFGVTVEGSKVIAVNLSSNNLVGTVPADLGNLSGLKELVVTSNQLTNIDTSSLLALEKLSCGGNNLTNLDVTQNTNLTRLSCGGNTYTSLDLSQNTNLIELYCNSTQVTDLDLSQNTALTTLYANYSALSTINLSQNTALETGQLGFTQLTHIDFSNCSNLKSFNCGYNSLLTEIDLKNGNNTAITGFYATGNSNLSCIQVDDIDFANTQVANAVWTKDTGTNFNTNCGFVLSTNEIALNDALNIYPNPSTGIINISTTNNVQIEYIEVYNMLGQRVDTQYNKNTINVSKLNIGMYLTKFYTSKGNITKKIIKK